MKELAEIAERYVGVEESPRGSNCGPVVNTFKAATTLSPRGDWPWCAAFVSFCVQSLIKESVRESIEAPPMLAAAYSFESWGKKNNALVFRPKNCPPYIPQRGDIVIFNFSHVGIVTKGGEKSFQTIEGNTNAAGGREGYQVARKTRTLASVVCFVRIAQKAEPVKGAKLHG